jgi:hypothetical protein
MKHEALSHLIKSTSLSQMRLVVLRPHPVLVTKPSQDTQDDRISELHEEVDKTRRVVLERTKHERDQLRAENLRLSHRISYLEEQVSDLTLDSPRPAPVATPTQQPIGRAKSEVRSENLLFLDAILKTKFKKC